MPRPRPLVDAALDRLQRNRPIVGAVATAVVDGVRAAAQREDTNLTEEDVPVVAEQVQRAIADNPVARSQTSNEPWWQNRVRVGLAVVGLGALLKIVKPDFGPWWDQNQELITTAVVGLGGGVAAIGEWLAAWLAGIDWRRPWTILGIGRQS